MSACELTAAAGVASASAEVPPAVWAVSTWAVADVKATTADSAANVNVAVEATSVNANVTEVVLCMASTGCWVRPILLGEQVGSGGEGGLFRDPPERGLSMVRIAALVR
jgi:hypothetical protein